MGGAFYGVERGLHMIDARTKTTTVVLWWMMGFGRPEKTPNPSRSIMKKKKKKEEEILVVPWTDGRPPTAHLKIYINFFKVEGPHDEDATTIIGGEMAWFQSMIGEILGTTTTLIIPISLVCVVIRSYKSATTFYSRVRFDLTRVPHCEQLPKWLYLAMFNSIQFREWLWLTRESSNRFEEQL